MKNILYFLFIGMLLVSFQSYSQNQKDTLLYKQILIYRAEKFRETSVN